MGCLSATLHYHLPLPYTNHSLLLTCAVHSLFYFLTYQFIPGTLVGFQKRFYRCELHQGTYQERAVRNHQSEVRPFHHTFTLLFVLYCFSIDIYFKITANLA